MAPHTHTPTHRPASRHPMPAMLAAAEAWRAAHAALDAACTALAAVPGAADQWTALCRISAHAQSSGTDEIDAAWRAAEGALAAEVAEARHRAALWDDGGDE
ncbi:hypothetical protein VQH23_26475 (plasmid) [Pararoseomonas sp. SCSIO 73927]|uniref:hypothetical protein n=1 Tax=Pararoseomonas sp. SCSIO 73927 TaxID=3114537 RepID=UPI0030CC8E8A